MPLTHYWAQMKRLDALARLYEPRVRRALVRGCEPCAAAVEAGADPALAAAYFKNGYLVAVLEDLYVACGTDEARRLYARLREAYPQKGFAPVEMVTGWGARLRRFITTEGAQSIRAVSETVRKQVRAVLTQAVAQGQGAAEAATALRRHVAGFSGREATRIVRTELIGASNFGSLLGAEATGLTLEKWWMATPGPRTRPEHQAAHGQGAPLQGGFFTVGGERCRYPGDPLLSAGMRINCRCAVGFRLPGTVSATA